MEVRVTARHESKATQEVQQRITDELTKLGKFYDRITSCRVVLDKEHEATVVEIVANAQGQTLSATAKHERAGTAIDEALDKVERQLKKLNEKIKNHKAVKDEA